MHPRLKSYLIKIKELNYSRFYPFHTRKTIIFFLKIGYFKRIIIKNIIMDLHVRNMKKIIQVFIHMNRLIERAKYCGDI